MTADFLLDFVKGEDMVDLRGQGLSHADLMAGQTSSGDAFVSIGNHTLCFGDGVAVSDISEVVFLF